MATTESELEYLTVERRDGVIVVTLDRPDFRNAFCVEMTRELRALIAEVKAWPERTIVITGAGDKAFSAGADLREMVNMTDPEARASLAEGVALTRSLELSPKMTIAAVNGLALGGGAEIALACDFRIASPSASLGLPEIQVGIFPGWGGTVRLPRLIHPGIALELLLTGRWVGAEEAMRIGLVNQVAEDPLKAALELADNLASGAPIAQHQAKLVVNRTVDMSLDDALRFEDEAWMRTFYTEDRIEGHQAFLERRAPNWSGR